MAIIFKGNKIVDCGVGISLPAGWDGQIEAHANEFIRTGKTIEIRDAGSITVPEEVARVALDAYKHAVNGGKSADEAVAEVSENSAVKRFLQSKGIEVASLGVATAQLLAAILGW